MSNLTSILTQPVLFLCFLILLGDCPGQAAEEKVAPSSPTQEAKASKFKKMSGFIKGQKGTKLKNKDKFKEMVKEAKAKENQFLPSSNPLERYSIREFKDSSDPKNAWYPGFQFNVPHGYGMDYGDLQLALSYQGHQRDLSNSLAVASITGGLGNSKKNVGIEASLNLVDIVQSPGGRGYLNLKAHHHFNGGFALAAGMESLLSFGTSLSESSFYLVGSTFFSLRQTSGNFLSVVSLTLGIGNGRFRVLEDIATNRVGINLFGSLGVLLARPLSLTLDWSGHYFAAGFNLIPFTKIPLSLSLGLTDLGSFSQSRVVGNIAYQASLGS